MLRFIPSLSFHNSPVAPANHLYQLFRMKCRSILSGIAIQKLVPISKIINEHQNVDQDNVSIPDNGIIVITPCFDFILNFKQSCPHSSGTNLELFCKLLFSHVRISPYGFCVNHLLFTSRYLLMLSARQIIAIEFNSVANKFISNAVFSIFLISFSVTSPNFIDFSSLHSYSVNIGTVMPNT